MTEENMGSSESHPIVTTRSGPSPTLVLLALVIAASVVFFFQNSHDTTIHFLFFEKDAKTRWAIIVAVALGVAIDRIFTMWWRRRRRRLND